MGEDLSEASSPSEVPDISYFSVLDSESENGAQLLRRAEDQPED